MLLKRKSLTVNSKLKHESTGLFVSCKKEIKLCDIYLIQSNGNYLHVFEPSSDNPHIMKGTMKGIAKTLGNDFIKVHRCYLARKSLLFGLYRANHKAPASIKVMINSTSYKRLPCSRREFNDVRLMIENQDVKA